MLTLTLGAFLLLGAALAYVCCREAGDPAHVWLAGTADGETQAPVAPPRLDVSYPTRGAVGGPVFVVQRDLRGRFDARKSERGALPPAA